MWRGILAIGLIYGCGHPSVDPYRPAVLDRPLQGFYNDVNSVVRDGRQALLRIEDMPISSYVKSLATYIVSEVRADVGRP
ncbi:MAG TPA: hypothetical protein VG985_00710 [Xanthobacteraceae bacterium]|nr:hypothetical protein [Xanthobacteraceae bacterium]